MAGLTATGFVAKTVEEVLAELRAAIRVRLGDDVDTSAESLVGQVLAVFATKIAEGYELDEAIYNARSPAGASGAALDVDAALCPGIERLPATKGTVTLSVTLAAGASLAVGAVARVAGEPSNRWVTTETVSNGGGAPAAVDVAAEAEIAGRTLANSGTITEIATPSVGWTAVTNAADAVPGTEIETDAAFRVRREQRLQRAGSSPLEAIAAQVAEVDGVTQAIAWENATDYTDAFGRPPHSVEVMVLGGLAADIGRALWDAKAGGIRTYGTEAGVTFTDANGQSRTVYFSRPTSLSVYVTARVTTDPDTYAGDTAVEDAILAAGEDYLAGEDPRVSDFILAVRAVTGVTDVEIWLGTAAGLGSQARENLSVGERQRAVFDSARVTVTVL